jgi:hypothetical protein
MVSSERESRVVMRMLNQKNEKCALLEVKVNMVCVGSHILVNLPQSVLPCMHQGM